MVGMWVGTSKATQHIIKYKTVDLITIYCNWDFNSKGKKGKGQRYKTEKGLNALENEKRLSLSINSLENQRAQGIATKKYFGEVVKSR